MNDTAKCIRGVLLDMDGTLTSPYFDFDGMERDIGKGKIDNVQYLLHANETERARVSAIIRRYEQDAAQNSPLNEGAREFLDWLKTRKLPVALITRNTRASVQTICKRFGLSFEIILTREDAPHKPSPAAILEISRRWHIPPYELLIVGDYKYDIEAGCAAGALTALLTNGKPPKWAHASDFIVHRLTDLIPILEKSSPSSSRQTDGGAGLVI